MASGIVYIVMHGTPDKACLASLYEPLLKRLPQAPHSGWEALDCAAMQRVRKPVWYQVLTRFNTTMEVVFSFD